MGEGLRVSQFCDFFEFLREKHLIWYRGSRYIFKQTASVNPFRVFRNIKRHSLAIGIFLVSFITGVSVFENFGIAWDDPSQHTTGEMAYNYMFAGDTSYNSYINRDYGVAFQVPLIMVEKILGLQDTRDIYNMRQLVTHLFFLLCTFFFYLLVYYLYKSRTLAITGYLLLLITPRIYAQSFFNSKDIPFMSMFILCFFACAIAFRSGKTKYHILFGALSGLLISIRVMGILVPFVITFFAIIDSIKDKNKMKTIVNYLCYLVACFGILVLTWPFLWEDPVRNFMTAFADMSKFRWDNTILVFGEEIHSLKLSWTYIPLWFGLTLPISYLLLGFTGVVFLVINFIKHPLTFFLNTTERNPLLYSFFFIGPVLAVIVLHSVVYDGWRQLYFIYPPFLLLAVYGLSGLLKIRARIGHFFVPVLSLLIFLSVLSTASFMVRAHPFEDIYFNGLLPSRDQYLRKSFDLDYWGTSYKQALEYIAAHDTSGKITVKVANWPGVVNDMILKEEDRKRITFVENTADAGYFISNYRWHPEDYDFPPDQKVFNIQVMNSDLCSVWKLK